MRLSEHFLLEEFTCSTEAVRCGLDNTPTAKEIAEAKRLCELVLEPLRRATCFGIKVTSGIRMPKVNKACGGANDSDHMDGRAADIQISGMTALEVCQAIVRLNLPFKQCIHEFGAWCHVSIPESGVEPKRQLLTAKKVKRLIGSPKTVYLAGIVEV